MGWRPHKRKALHFYSWSPSARQGTVSKPPGVEVEGHPLRSASPPLVSRKAWERKRCLGGYRCRKMKWMAVNDSSSISSEDRGWRPGRIKKIMKK
ncbi:hypothetical protein EJB05_01656, partial [Eragrostis curvula]